MTKNRRQRRQQQNRSNTPSSPTRPVESAPIPAPVETAVRCEPNNTRDTPPRPSFWERCKDNLEAAKETCVERIVDLTLLLCKCLKCFKILGIGVKWLNMVTYLLLIVASQLWLSMSILYYCVDLIRGTKVNFRFPLEDYQKFLLESSQDLAWWFRLLVLSCVGIAFLHDLFSAMEKRPPPVQRLRVYWNLFIAQIIMYTFIPFMDNFGDIMNVVLTLVTCARLAIEVSGCQPDEIKASLDFVMYGLVYHCIFLTVMSVFLLNYEYEKAAEAIMANPRLAITAN